MRVFAVPFCVLILAIAGCGSPWCRNNLPPAERIMEPGPGVGGPGPGIMVYQPTVPFPGMSSQIAFLGPEGMQVNWDVGAPGRFDSEPLLCPGRYNFPQGAIYRLKLSNIAGRPGVELYPTLEVGMVMPRTEAFLAHNAIPIQFAEEDFDQVLSGNFVTKVIYLPDPEFQQLALAGAETLVSTRLDPGVDPIVEADRRGAILAIVRLGNKDLQLPDDPVRAGGVMQASYQASVPGPSSSMPSGPSPLGVPVGSTSTLPSNYIAGVTAPQWGMPTCGTPIGLPGPPHVPFGVPAGLQKHTIVNHTATCIPGPTKQVRIDVKQNPGFSYPAPANHVRIVEDAHKGLGHFRQPPLDKLELLRGGAQAPCAQPCEGQCPIDP